MAGRSGATNVVYCNITVKSIIYTYTPPFSSSSSSGIYTISSWTPASPRITSLVAAYVDSGYPQTRVEDTVEGAGYLGQGQTYEQAFGLELSRELMAFTGMIWMQEEALSAENATHKLGSRIQIVPFVLYVVVVIFYRCVRSRLGWFSIIVS